jgi:hypothetical protein
MNLDQVAAEIGVTPDILTYNVSENEGLLIGQIIMMMKLSPRPRELEMLRELSPPTKS